MNERAILEVQDVKVQLGDSVLVSDVSFVLPKGDMLAIVGPNGGGKSTLLRALLGILPYSGTIQWADGVRIGYVPQKLAIDRTLPLSVREFFSLRKGSKDVVAVCAEVGLNETILQKSLGILSGGEFQRVMVAWALAGDPTMLLFDEPVAGLDKEGEETIYGLLSRLHAERNMPMIIVSHDLEMVSRTADLVLCLQHKPLYVGEPAGAFTPQILETLYGVSKIAPHHHQQP